MCYTTPCPREGKRGYFFDIVKVRVGPPSIFQFSPVICLFTETAFKRRSKSQTIEVFGRFAHCSALWKFFKNTFKHCRILIPPRTLFMICGDIPGFTLTKLSETQRFNTCCWKNTPNLLHLFTCKHPISITSYFKASCFLSLSMEQFVFLRYSTLFGQEWKLMWSLLRT